MMTDVKVGRVLTADLEMHVSEQLRDVALREVKDRGLEDEHSLAEALHLFPSGARRLMNESRWSLDTGLRVLAALGVDVRVESVKG